MSLKENRKPRMLGVDQQNGNRRTTEPGADPSVFGGRGWLGIRVQDPLRRWSQASKCRYRCQIGPIEPAISSLGIRYLEIAHPDEHRMARGEARLRPQPNEGSINV